MTKKADEAKADYLAGLSYKEIAERYGVLQGTVRGWKSRYQWDEDNVLQQKLQRNTKTLQQNATVLQQFQHELTDKQKLFCAYYMQRFNATWAYPQSL